MQADRYTKARVIYKLAVCLAETYVQAISSGCIQNNMPIAPRKQLYRTLSTRKFAVSRYNHYY